MSVPRDATAQEEPEAVVVEAPETVTDAPCLLDQQIDGLGAPVRAPGVVEGEDLGLPAGHGGGKADELGHLQLGAVGVEAT